ncbi:MAG: CcoQ/FixQ family Cbb3-type cytochrome c oxidase assembly chaperone [Lysobacteraceae bacterium]
MQVLGMETGTLFGVSTTVLLATFVGGWIWAWRPGRRAAFEAAARLPLEDDNDANDEIAMENRQ